MYYSNIKTCDIADGEGVRVSIFISGCNNHCKGCQQPETWDFEYGKPVTDETLKYLFNNCNHTYINGLTVLGGEPMEPKNQYGVMELIKKFKAEFPNKSVWIYSGFTFEQLMDENHRSHTEYTKDILNMSDVLVDGLFVEELKNLSLKFRGSTNQRLIDLKNTFKNNKVVLAPIKDRIIL